MIKTNSLRVNAEHHTLNSQNMNIFGPQFLPLIAEKGSMLKDDGDFHYTILTRGQKLRVYPFAMLE